MGNGECYDNQTSSKSFKFLKEAVAKGKTLEGWGNFVVAAPELGPGMLKAVYVDKLSYEDCCERAGLCIMFKWVAQQEMPYKDAVKNREEALKHSKAGILTRCLGNQDCRDGSDCDVPGCFCYKGKCHFF